MIYRIVKCRKCGKEHKTKFNSFKCCGILQSVRSDIIVLESVGYKRKTNENKDYLEFKSNPIKISSKSNIKKLKIIPTKKEVNKNGEFGIDKRRISATYGKSKEETITATST